MKELLGTTFTGLVTDENEHSYFIQKQGITFRLDKSEGEHELGEAVEGFGYVNQQGDYRMTTEIPAIRQGQYAFGEVVATRRDLGAFVDIGLPDKEMALSLDELSEMRELWPKKGDKLCVTLRVDDKNRMWASLAEDEYIHSLSRVATEDMHNKDVLAIVYRTKLVGTFVLTEDYHLGFIHPDEREQEPRLGEEVKARVIGVRPDGMLNLSLKPRAHEVISDDAMMILTFLEQSRDGVIPYSDKSTPEEIKQMFAISKGQFKRALGSLMKQGEIKQENGKTYLIKK
ncbi:S1-like domain-containing RNA-binding protein [Vagococcus lutrae]|uniref:CvfB family protein n=1 Tax=Vagococcus lutrae TaxID=81947 RepID=UPI00200D951B|nr:S1-like domain-containing RNA-binding protein [Vagococcus lutrae]UQF70882.1 S1-like domain-containing RNA-binding protein [Vagococcus lutrae]